MKIFKKRIVIYLQQLSFKKRKNFLEALFFHLYKNYWFLKQGIKKCNNPIISKAYLYSKNLKKSITGGKFTFITVDNLVNLTTDFVKSFPSTFDLIVGIPRSGLLVANVIALKLGKPLTTPELFLKNEYWISKLISKKEDYLKILLVDDSVTSGKSLDDALSILLSSGRKLSVVKAAVIVTEDATKKVDLYHKIISHPRVFEWNLLHSKKGVLVADLDGVICENCPPRVDADENAYLKWIETAKPYLIPSFEVDYIVSNRLERYRQSTEKWLEKYNVLYKKLILWNISSKEDRQGRHAQNKIGIYLKIKPDYIWESSLWESEEIWKALKIPILCVDEMKFFC